VIHACTRTVCKHKASRGGRRKLKQRGDAAGLVNREGQPFCNTCAHRTLRQGFLEQLQLARPSALGRFRIVIAGMSKAINRAYRVA
jgi:hypothetical protein